MVNRNINQPFDYSLITESPGLKATREQLERLYQRYHFARQFARDKDVLEVACGSGMGLAYIASVARKIVGVDIEERNLNVAKKYCNNRSNIDIKLTDAHKLAFLDKCFDVVLFYEAIYYLQEPEKFISEAERVLRKSGSLIICTVNRDWEDFHPSPYSYKYFSVLELYGLLKNKFTEVEMYGGFPVNAPGIRNKTVSLIKRTAVNFNLIPGSLKARAYLKRIFMGKLTPLPQEVYEDMAFYRQPEPIVIDKINKNHKIIYAVARK